MHKLLTIILRDYPVPTFTYYIRIVSILQEKNTFLLLTGAGVVI